MIIDESALAGLHERYSNVHPLIFHRSMEKAKSLGELFDILEGVSDEDYPLVWCEALRRWVTTDDIFQSQAYVDLKEKRSN
jgi:hypothetical protein